MESIMIDLIISLFKDAYSGLVDRIKLYFIKKRLKTKIFNEILSKYGNEVYYDSLDKFLIEHQVIYIIIKNNSENTLFDYKSDTQIVNYYVQLFCSQYPNYKRYQYDIRNILQKYFEIIYCVLNKSSKKETKIVCDIAKNFSYKLAADHQEIKQELKKLNQKMDSISNNVTEMPNRLIVEEYKKYLLCLYPTYSKDKYLDRKIFSHDINDSQTSSLDALLLEKHVLILGEAGYGKTYEAITLLKNACSDVRTSDLIPIFLPLQEYGMLYHDIADGIKDKLGSFCEGKVEQIIEQYLKAGKFILIFDGIDDISQESYRSKFYTEIRNYLGRYKDNYYFLTARYNRYHRELAEIKEYSLTEINEQTIQNDLRNEKIFVELPNSYYQLFSNPFFLRVGEKILKKSVNREIFNRSRLFEELFQNLYGNNSHHGGFADDNPLTYHDAQYILGEFAFNTFSCHSYRYLEFEKKLSEIIPGDKTSIIGSFVSSGLFKIEDKVTFAHRLLKEYCVAYYMVFKYPLAQNIEFYKKLLELEEWREVLIFIGGLYTDSQSQDEYLDFIMSNNFPLYIECVNAKSDVNEFSNLVDSSTRLLSQILNSYIFIIDKYFKPIQALFAPGFDPDIMKLGYTEKIGICGYVTEDKSWLFYWFDIIKGDELDVKYVNEYQYRKYFDLSEKNALRERKHFSSYGVNLRLSGLSEDSGRKIAIDIIKSQLKDFIEKRKLIESKYLLCERISCFQKKEKSLNEFKDLEEMQTFVDEKINNVLREFPDTQGYWIKDINLFSVRDILHCLTKYNIKFEDSILPGPDITSPIITPCFMWDLYTRERKEILIFRYFFFHGYSYASMVEENFPNLKRYFRQYNDMPYQDIIEVDYKEFENPHDYNTQPVIQHYYIASSTNENLQPRIIQKRESDFTDFDQVRQTIRESYLKKGRTIHGGLISNMLFSTIINSRGPRDTGPLSDYVYNSIKDSLQDVFGRYNW